MEPIDLSDQRRFFAELRQGDTAFISKVNLHAAFLQMPVHAEYQPYLCFMWKGEVYRHLGAPFGVTTIPGRFQRAMETILTGIPCFIYMDDVVVVSADLDTHVSTLRRILQAFNRYNLRISPSKSAFGASSARVLGSVIDDKGTYADPVKARTLQEWPTPTSVKELRGFLGLGNYLAPQIPGWSRHVQPLYRLISSARLEWDDAAESAWRAAKEAASRAVALAHFDGPPGRHDGGTKTKKIKTTKKETRIRKPQQCTVVNCDCQLFVIKC